MTKQLSTSLYLPKSLVMSVAIGPNIINNNNVVITNSVVILIALVDGLLLGTCALVLIFENDTYFFNFFCKQTHHSKDVKG